MQLAKTHAPLVIALLAAFACSPAEIPPEANVEDGDADVAMTATLRIPLETGTPASAVSDEAVTLTDADGFELRGTATLEAETSTLVFTPIRPMIEGTEYVLASDSLRDLAGELLSVQFTTLANPFHRQINYIPGTGIPDDYSEFRDNRSLFFDGPGPDRVFLTEDDDLAQYTETEDRVGDDQLSVTYGDPGSDGMFFTSDDQPTSFRRSFFAGQRVVRRHSFSTGPDNEIGTGDDVLSQIRFQSYDEDGQLRELRIFFDGGDNIPESSDDIPVAGFVVEYDARGLSTRFVGIDPGPDSELFTADDVVPTGPPTSFYDDNGVYIGSLDPFTLSTNYVDSLGRSYREDFFEAGSDNALETPDDRLFLRLEFLTP